MDLYETDPLDPVPLLGELVKCPSVTPENAGVLDVLEAYLKRFGFTVTRLIFEGDGSYPVDNLFATRGTGGKHLLFAGHTDVVPPGPDSQWSHPPFAADIVDGVMHGRGTVDMKSGVAAMCAAVARAVETGSADKGTLSLAITNDEEADSINGTDKLMQWADAEGHRFDFAIVGEPSSAKRLGDRLKVGRRGTLNGEITVTGVQGHSAYPDKAKNPLPVLAAIAQTLADTPLDEGTANFQPSTLALTNIAVGNKATNVIPGAATLFFNVRFNDVWTHEKLMGWVADRVGGIDPRGTTIDIAYPKRGAEAFMCKTGDGVQIVDDAILALTGALPEHSTTGGTSDGRFITRYCPVIECGVVGETIHQANERVPLEEVEGLTRLYADIIARYFA